MALASTNIENNPEEAASGSAASGAQDGPLSQLKGSTGSSPLSQALTKQIGGLEKARSEKKGIIDEAIKNLSSREAPKGPSSEELFRLMGAFAAPTRTGGFAETLGNVGNTTADILGKRTAGQSSLEDLKTKYKLQGIDVDSEHLKEMIDAHKTMAGENAPSSAYGKLAKDEGLQPGTPSYNARVSELAAQDTELKKDKISGNKPAAGQFDPKSGNYIAPNGTVIKASEIKEDRAGRDSIAKLQDAVKSITPQVTKQAQGWDWTTGDTSKFIASKLMPKQLAAQVKVNAGALQERLKNLPPGPASDKDIAQARSSFPGFGDAKALDEWTKTTDAALTNYLKRQDEKYGDAQWYGAGAKAPGSVDSGAGASAPGASPPAASAPDNSGQLQPDALGRYSAKPVPSGNKAASGVPKVGAVLKGYRFKGGDPHDKNNWEKS